MNLNLFKIGEKTGEKFIETPRPQKILCNRQRMTV